MAKNGSKGGGRKGAIKQRSQFQHPNGRFVKRDTKTGRILDVKADGKPFKSVRKESGE
ncbi:MAG: hypothetical protein QM589_18810 [Thermomicrobiales bacterium]